MPSSRTRRPGRPPSSPGPGERPIVHADRGCHYRWDGRKAACSDFGLTRSMSRPTSPDNAACEGFFGAFKNEVFYGRDWSGWTAEEFMALLEAMIEMVVVGPPQGIPRRRAAALRYDRRPPYAAGARRIGRRVQENVRTPSFLKLLPRLRPWLRSSMLFGVNGRDINANGMAQEMKIAENNPAIHRKNWAAPPSKV